MAGEVGRGGLYRNFALHLFFGLRNMARQEDAEGGAAAFGRIAEYPAAGLLDDAIDHRQAKPGALADLLGREERLENLVHNVGGNAGAGVLHLDGDIVGGHQRRFAEARAFGRGDVLRAQGDLAAVGHGVARIDDEIHHNLLELVDVRLHQPQVAPVLQVQIDLLAHKAAQQHLQVGQHVAQLQHLRAERLAAREGEQLTRQRGGAVRVLLDLHDVLEGRIGRAMVGEQQVRIADDRGEHIVEVMRNAAGQLADGVHLLRLREILLQRALLRDVECIDVGARAVAEIFGRGDEEARRMRPVARQRGVDGDDLALAGNGCGQRVFQHFMVALGDAIVEIAGFMRGRAEFGEGGIGAHDPTGLVDGGDGHRGLVEKARKAHLRRAQILEPFFAGRAIDDERARGPRRAVMGESDAVEQAHGQDLAIAALQVEVELLGAHLTRRAGGG